MPRHCTIEAMANGSIELQNGRFLDVVWQRDQIVFSLDRALSEHFGLNLRRAEAASRVGKNLRSIGPVVQSESGFEFNMPCDAARGEEIVDARKRLDRDLKTIAERPLTSRLAQETLGITGRERIRWTKYGRPAGSDAYNMGQQRVMTSSARGANHIRDLAVRASLVEEWRVGDEEWIDLEAD